MNIKDFLIDNYIWILVIILITIVTIIGFLADKKKGDKKKEDNTPQTPNNNQSLNPGMTLQYPGTTSGLQNQMNNNMGINYNNVNQQPQMNPNMMNNQLNSTNNVNMLNNQNINNAQNMMMTEPQPIPVVPNNMMAQMNSPQPVEVVAPEVEQEPMYQPLSEQKPVLPPQPIPNFNNQVNGNNQMATEPMTGTVVPSTAQNFVPTPTVNNMTSPVDMQPQMVAVEQPVNQMPMYNNINAMPVDNYNVGMNTQQVQNNTTIPQPVNPTVIPVPQPVTPQHIPMPQYNSQPVMPQSYNQPEHVNMTQPTEPSPVITTAQPINFVYGPQNNNQNM